MLRVFIGVDQRAPLSYTVLQSSIIRRSSEPVQITPILLHQMPMKRRGLTDFTYTRYLVPYLCGYEGSAVFMDADIICLSDIKELFDIAEKQDADVCVVNHEKKFERPSVMVFNNARCKNLTPEYIENGSPASLEWAEKIGELPHEFNHLVGYDEPNQNAKIIHFTQGVPCWHETADCEFSEEWKEERKASELTCTWSELMGNSVHAEPVLKRLFAGYQASMKRK